MSWSVPRTWTLGEKLTAAIFNAHVRDNLIALYTAVGPTSIPGMMTQYIWCTLGGSDGHRPVVAGTANEAWHLCNGDADIDGSGITAPDWRNRIIIGAGDTYAQGATGGAATKDMSHTHAVGSLETVATTIPNHVHAISDDSNYASAGKAIPSIGAGGSVTEFHVHAVSGNTGNPTGSPTHTHTVSGTTASGGSATQSVLPPYHALYGFIYVGT